MASYAVEGVVDELRADILAGRLRPGVRLVEPKLAERLEVSRNTLREAFRVLAHDQLVEHRPNRGVFVRRLTPKEAADVYVARRLVEPGALREAAVSRHEALAAPAGTREIYQKRWEAGVLAVRSAVEEGLVARRQSDWVAVGTANGRFHLALVALAENDVLDRVMRTLLSEMRLLFVVAGDAREVHDPYLDDNVHVMALVEAGELVRAAVALEAYLLRAERHLLGRYRGLGNAA